MDNSNLYSYHVFLFPFQWKLTGRSHENANLEQQSDLLPFMQLLKGSAWKRSNFETDAIIYFNEKNYFYPFVRDILYDTSKEPSGIAPEFIAHYEYDIMSESMDYTIQISPDKTYILKIDSILLHLYNTGIGIISFHLNNRLKSQSDAEDILIINQFGRRLYPPFLSVDPEFIGKQGQYAYNNYQQGLKGVKKAELAQSISVGHFKEDWSRYEYSVSLEKEPFIIPEFIKGLFATVPITGKIEFKSEDTAVFIKPVLGDRMFVVCWYGNDEFVDAVRADVTGEYDFKAIINETGEYAYLYNEWLYKFTFIDKGLSCQNDRMRIEAMKNHINARWVNYGTLFGVSRYSFVAVTQSLQASGFRENAAFVINHVQTMYYKLVELSLVQRASILKFSDEVARVSIMAETKDLGQQVNSLYKQYIRFVNKVYFREVTAEEQGIELYDLLQEKMRIDKNVTDLDKEINELHNYLNIVEESRRNNYLEVLTKLGAAFMIPTFIVGFFGMNMFNSGVEFNEFSSVAFVLVMSIIPAIILFFINRKKQVSLVPIAVGYIILLTIMFFVTKILF